MAAPQRGSVVLLVQPLRLMAAPQRGSVVLLVQPLRLLLVPAAVAVGDTRCRGEVDGEVSPGNCVCDQILALRLHQLPVSCHSASLSCERRKKRLWFAAGCKKQTMIWAEPAGRRQAEAEREETVEDLPGWVEGVLSWKRGRCVREGSEWGWWPTSCGVAGQRGRRIEEAREVSR